MLCRCWCLFVFTRTILKMLMSDENKPLRLISIFFPNKFIVSLDLRAVIWSTLRCIIMMNRTREMEKERLSTHNVIFKIHKSHYRELARCSLLFLFRLLMDFVLKWTHLKWTQINLIMIALIPLFCSLSEQFGSFVLVHFTK